MRNKLPASLRVIGRSIVDWWDGWLDMVIVTIIWLVAQVTIIFGPPATFGLYYVAHEMVNGQALGVRGLISGARRYFWKAWLWGILNILATIILSVNLYFYGNIDAGWAPFLLVLMILLGILWYCTQFYAIPYFLEQDVKNIFISWRNGLLTTLAAPFYTLILMIVVVIVLGLSISFVIPLFLGLPAIIPFLGLRALLDRLEAFGLREREKTPRELEYEESGKVEVPGLVRSGSDNPSTGDILDRKRKIK